MHAFRTYFSFGYKKEVKQIHAKKNPTIHTEYY